MVPTCQHTNSTSTYTRCLTDYLSARASTSVQSTTDDQVVPVHALVQLLQAVIVSSCYRTSSELTKIFTRLAMILHTWLRIVMWYISSHRSLTSMEYFDLKALAICLHCLKKIYIYKYSPLLYSQGIGWFPHLGGGQVGSSPDSAPLWAATPRQALASGLQLQLKEFWWLLLTYSFQHFFREFCFQRAWKPGPP